LICQRECEKTENCTAFSYNINVIRNCELYRGGPYTHGRNIYDSNGNGCTSQCELCKKTNQSKEISESSDSKFGALIMIELFQIYFGLICL